MVARNLPVKPTNRNAPWSYPPGWRLWPVWYNRGEVRVTGDATAAPPVTNHEQLVNAGLISHGLVNASLIG